MGDATPPSSRALALLSDPQKTTTTVRASSILQKNTKLYGPMNALDVANGSSSWNSEGKPPQPHDDDNNTNNATTFLTIHFHRPVVPRTIRWQFQAGFAAETCRVYGSAAADHNDHTAPSSFTSKTAAGGGMELLDELELDDVHEIQSSELDNRVTVDSLKLVLDDCCDFYDRVIVYALEVWGYEVVPE